MVLAVAIFVLVALSAATTQEQNTEQLYGDIYYEIGSFSLHYPGDPGENGNRCQREVP